MWAFVILGGIALVLGIGLAVANDVLHVEEDNRLEKVLELLPGVNCGACGYPGCAGFANAIVEGEVEVLSKCKPGSKGTNLEKIREFLETTEGPDGKTIKVKV